MLRFLPFIIWFALALYAMIDCVRTPADRMPGRLAKPLWILLIILVPLGLGAVAWIIVSGAQRAEDAAAGRPIERTPRPSRPSPQRRSSRPVAPDDDPDFLAQLEQQARAKRRERRKREREGRQPETRPADDELPEQSGD